MLIHGPVAHGGSAVDSDASAFKSEVEGAGGTLASLSFTSSLITALKAVTVGAGNAYTQMLSGYYPGAYKLFNVDGRLDVIYDFSRHSNHFSSNNSDANRPVIALANLNGQPVSQHGATQGWMRFNGTYAQPVSSVLITKPKTSGITANDHFNLGGLLYCRRLGANNLKLDGYQYADLTVVDDSWNSFSMRLNDALGATGFQNYMNTAAGTPSDPYGASSAVDFKMGGIFDAGADVDIGIALVYNLSLTNTELQNVETALRSAFAVTTT